MLIDSHTHIGLNEFCKPGSLLFEYDLENRIEDFVYFMNMNNIEKSVILPIPGDNYDSCRSNEYLHKASMLYKDRFIPFCKFDNNLAINITYNGFLGAKYHVPYEKYSNLALERYYKMLEYYNCPLMIHAKYANKASQIRRIISAVPNLKIIIAHLGRGHIYTDEMVEELVDELANEPNVYFETSTVGRMATIESICKKIDSKRVMFGSDYPFGKAWFKDSFSYDDEIDIISKARISEEDKSNIFHNTILSISEEHKKRMKYLYMRPIVSQDKEILLSRLETLCEQDRKMLALDKKTQQIRDNIKKCRHIYVAIANDEIVGFIRESGRQGDTTMLEEITVFEKYRGNGYANGMLDFFTKFFPKSLAKTHSNNIKIKKILSKYGFIADNGLRITNWSRSV